MSCGRVLIYGGKGALGSKCVSHFKSNGWWVASVSTKENPEADVNIIVDKCESPMSQEQKVLEGLKNALDGEKFDSIFCVAGGWIGGNAEKDLVKNCELMWQQSVNPSLISASVASKFLKEDGILSLTGAKAALDSTPGMLAYGISKAAVQFMAKSLSNEKSGLPKGALSVAILPTTLDTPMNRKWMPDADFSCWTPLEFVAELFLKWSNGQERPKNGTLLKLEMLHQNSQDILPPGTLTSERR
ncbi:dihydropteridine reductase-like [Agrilus planipennis]|uniref:Dihydropteridine reductase n=1 Tax=Agrilus planipennis TaxID=224129 RepID=A0A1W4WYS8_AGRPL|nr:dihydropteridine reductase-like [Agrilus planipennis]